VAPRSPSGDGRQHARQVGHDPDQVLQGGGRGRAGARPASSSPAGAAASPRRSEGLERLKFWLGLPNRYYGSDEEEEEAVAGGRAGGTSAATTRATTPAPPWATSGSDSAGGDEDGPGAGGVLAAVPAPRGPG
jgi:hypothetical protein